MGKFYQIKNAYPLLKNRHKYVGKSKVITLRSGYEINWVFKFLDIHPSVIEWCSEEVIIQYFSPADNRIRRYFVDFWMKILLQDGSIKEYLIEIKPKKQTEAPTQKKKTKRYIDEVATYIKNKAKWEAAEKLCEEKRTLGRNIEFKVITENDIPT